MISFTSGEPGRKKGSRRLGYQYPGLQCKIERLEYDFIKRVAVLFLPYGCVHAPGAITLAQRIDPDVRAVATVSEGMLDTCYQRDPSKGRPIGNGWHAWRPRDPVRYDAVRIDL